VARLVFDFSVLRVLLVEDDTFAREMELTALQHLGISRITIASDGTDALDILERNKTFDLIISDWNMRPLDGIGLVTSVRRHWPSIAFVMITNNETVERVHQATDAGVDGYLIKPFSLNKLREVIQLALMSRVESAEGLFFDQSKQRPANPELDEVSNWLHGVLAQPVDQAGGVEQKNDEAITVLENRNLAAKVSNQLTGFISLLDASDPAQLSVIRLHVDCIRAILSGRNDLLEHETRNAILDGLTLAADLVTD
jgi:two-component system, chemotaxis family, chemotaxis protein CheY